MTTSLIALIVSLPCIPALAKACGLENWSALTPMPQGRAIHCCVAVDEYIYVIGGETGPSVYFARVRDDATLDVWKATTPIPDRIGHNYTRSIAMGRRIYLFGGQARAGEATDTVAYADANSDGSLGAWRTTAPLPRPCLGGEIVIDDNRRDIYYVGGFYRRHIFHARLDDSGLIAAWNEIGHLVSPRCGFGAVIVAGRMYIFGGNTGHLQDTEESSVFAATIRDDRALDRFTRATPLPSPNDSFASVLIGNHVFLLGGRNAAAKRDRVLGARINADGSVSDWIEQAPLPQGLWSCAAVYVKGCVFITGGFFQKDDGSTGISNAVYVARVHVRE